MKHSGLPWPPLEAALSILKVCCSVKNEFLKMINKNKIFPPM